MAADRSRDMAGSERDWSYYLVVIAVSVSAVMFVVGAFLTFV